MSKAFQFVCMITLLSAAECDAGSGANNDEVRDFIDSDENTDTTISCGTTWLAPPNMPFGGGLAVPIDVEQLDANVTLKVVDRQAVAQSRLTFSLGPSGGFPVFDHRQRPIFLRLDGEPLEASLIERVEFATTDTGGVLVLHRELAPCSRHELVIGYEINSEVSSAGGQSMLPHWAEGVFWNSAFSDSTPGMLMERWFPVGLIHDTFALEIELHVEGGDSHTFLANAPIEMLGANHWRVRWNEADPSTPLWYVSPAGHILHRQDNLAIVDVYYAAGLFGSEQDDWLSTAHEAIQQFATRFGVHADMERPYLLIIDPFQQLASGTEYANGAIVSRPTREVLRHEILHAWFGRSLLPARHIDAWWDEGATTFFSAEDSSFSLQALAPLDPFDPNAEPIAPTDAWARGYPSSAYSIGARVFATVVDLLGRDRVERALRNIVETCPRGHITHHDLVELFGAIGERVVIEALFASWVIPKSDAVLYGTCR